MTELRLQIPAKMRPFMEPARYKGAKGGRGSAKSWSVARLLLGARALPEKTRILCAREAQKSIKDSVHKLLSDQIESLGLSSFYEIQQATIKGANGSEFLFAGLQDHTADSVRSFEGCDICWIEEAHTVSQRSWEILIPTIRKPGSEIWATWNPEDPGDPVEDIYVANPMPGTVCVEMNWRDNPWFPSVLDDERRKLERLNPDLYAHVWEGKYRTAAGLMFKRNWFKWYEREPARLNIYMSADYAVTEDDGDYTEIAVWGMDADGNLYALDWWSGQTSPDTWIEAAIRFVKLYKPQTWFEESGGILRSVDGAINRAMRDNNAFCMREALPSATNKAARALGFAARASSGAVFLPVGKDWAVRLLNQLCAFNGEPGQVDDMVDACSLAGRGIDKMMEASRPRKVAAKVADTPFSYAAMQQIIARDKAEEAEKRKYFE